MHIVIVDDSVTNTAVMAALARSVDAEVSTYRCPAAALERLACSTADIIIVDFHMPGMDGSTLASKLRSSQVHPTTPILMVTHDHTLELRRRAEAAGVSGFLTKPFDAIQFKATLRRFLGAQGVPQQLKGLASPVP